MNPVSEMLAGSDETLHGNVQMGTNGVPLFNDVENGPSWEAQPMSVHAGTGRELGAVEPFE
jgi:hypothetical protein